MGRRLQSNDNGRSEPSVTVGIYTFVVPEDLVYGDDVIASIFGLPERSLVEGAPIAEVLRYVQNGDRQRLAKAMHEAIVSGSFRSETYRVVHPDGQEYLVCGVGRCLRDRQGLPSMFSGTVTILDEAAPETSGDPLERHCQAALTLAERRKHSLAARYISSALSVLKANREA
ncbi:hypothetical protein ABID21_002167 [Pseudorhizobium tarimense]|uniref:PAS fold-3 domain-containing protein n=1 Tax=Pseudorhizobium tarimense TaxID=1079109 RepID=A0ABV2H6K5_9HYPH|nr:PAS domain-containing protein [Pseudorhizobium tarimense]MCJ8519112.1 PAS domain-containing protein [Pseudorhizobium tarimense]